MRVRHFALTWAQPERGGSMDQGIALRCASDDAFLGVGGRAARERRTKDVIQRAVAHWRPDTHMV